MVDAIVPPPVPTEDDLARAANREPASRGIRYYTGPGFSEALEGVGEVLKAVDPAQGIMRGMAATGRAFDSNLPADERRAAGIEAFLETVTPIGMMGIGSLAKQPIKATLLDVLTPTGAPSVMNDAVEDVSRRAFLKGAAAAVPVAAVAPDVLTEALNAGTKASARVAAASSNPIGYSVSLIKAGTDQINDLVEAAAGRGEMAIGNRGEYKDKIFAVTDSLRDLRLEALADLTPSNVRNAGDAELDEFLRDFYEYNPMTGGNEAYNHPNFELVLQEIKRRGLHLMQDRGIDRYPFARAAMDDFGSTVTVPSGGAGISTRPTDLNMVRNLSDDIMSSVNELRIMAKRRELSDGLKVMQDRGDSLATQEAFVERMEREIAELQGNFTQLPPDMDDFYAKGGEVVRDDVPYPKPYNRAQGIINYFYLMMNPEKPEPEKPKPYVQSRPSSQRESLGKQINFPGFAEGGDVMSDREAMVQMADTEYEMDMQPYLQDSLSQLGFDPKKIRVGSPQSTDNYSALSDEVTMDPAYGMMSRETQAHEFRHRGLQRLLEDYFMLDPGRFKALYGEDAYNLMVQVDQQQGRRVPIADRVQERVAEMFQRPEEIYLGTVYNTSDGRVFQTAQDAADYARQNPGVEFRAQEIRPNLDSTFETPRAIEFRDYMINKNRGETMQQGTDAEFEAVLRLQDAASDVLAGVGSLNETARGMFR